MSLFKHVHIYICMHLCVDVHMYVRINVYKYALGSEHMHIHPK